MIPASRRPATFAGGQRRSCWRWSRRWGGTLPGPAPERALQRLAPRRPLGVRPTSTGQDVRPTSMRQDGQPTSMRQDGQPTSFLRETPQRPVRRRRPARRAPPRQKARPRQERDRRVEQGRGADEPSSRQERPTLVWRRHRRACAERVAQQDLRPPWVHHRGGGHGGCRREERSWPCGRSSPRELWGGGGDEQRSGRSRRRRPGRRLVVRHGRRWPATEPRLRHERPALHDGCALERKPNGGDERQR